MKRKAIIDINSIQRNEDGNENTTAIHSTGIFFEKDHTYYLLYEDTNSESNGSTNNTLKIENNRVTLTRRGEIRSRMCFETGSSHLTEYVTQFGTLHLTINTLETEISISDSACQIFLRYTLSDDCSVISDNQIEIRAKLS